MKKELLNIEKESNIFVNTKTKKKQIMLGHTSRNLEDYLQSLDLRHNGKYGNLPHYIISKEGVEIEIMNPDKITNFFGYTDIDTNSITVLLENEGWLAPKKGNHRLCDWLGNIYNGEVFEKEWRNKFFWATYTDKQLEGLLKLLDKLCVDLDINREFVGHNVRVEGVEKFEGIVSRSNYSEFFTDLSPAFNFEKIKEII